MGRHSRRGPAPKGDSSDITHIAGQREERDPASGPPRTAQRPTLPGQRQAPGGGTLDYGPPRTARSAPGFPPGTPVQGVPRLPDGTPAPGVPRYADGTPAQGVPLLPDGTPVRGVPRLPDGTPAHGVPRLPDGTPVHGVPGIAGGAPGARGGHPEQREGGGGWGGIAGPAGGGDGVASGVRRSAGGPGVTLPRQRQGQGRQQGRTDGSSRGPRQDYLDAFGEDVDVFAPRSGGGSAEVRESRSPAVDTAAAGAGDGAPPAGVPAQRTGGKGRAFTGIAAAAVTTVLAVVVAGQVADDRDGPGARSQSATDQARDARGHGEATPSAPPSVATLTYEQKMDRKYPLGATLKGSGKFEAVPGFDKAPGKGQKYTYRVDVEQGLGLDGALFAEAVQKTLNDRRSWAHGGARTFERISSGKPDFVITLASPGTTGKWCAKSGLDTTEDNVSCDSASTERVMINAYRWAQGSKTYGDKMYAYRQMLINHEVGHRLGHGHVTCQKDGELAPVMQQQTKFLDHDGIHCLPNPWPYPGS
ncbi:hypothetical protein J2Z21_002068 [Streptomyces griseochromogenes]|uniref:DUF3152 domain-containing protein n=1 Tax=Streptomyces griseochromogenes TaxID=68214 RepID=A0ABS4LP22_9ACTN|nr:DUF3152 domain-containing protein [Streptomyces griseochromogenes]MBP2049137.1 hypothetical protein [Streptomyces griseochromogenes]